MLLIIIISDYQTMIIPDEVLIPSGILILIELWIKEGNFISMTSHIFDGIVSFLIMLALKKLGDYLFRKESMGGGDLKLMVLLGFVLGWKMSIITIFLASFIGLPISLIILYKNKTDIIPFGPFLSVSAIILYLTQIQFDQIINFFTM